MVECCSGVGFVWCDLNLILNGGLNLICRGWVACNCGLNLVWCGLDLVSGIV